MQHYTAFDHNSSFYPIISFIFQGNIHPMVITTILITFQRNNSNMDIKCQCREEALVEMKKFALVSKAKHCKNSNLVRNVD